MVGTDWTLLLRPSGRRIVRILLGSPRTLTQLADSTRLSKPSILAQLRRLELAGVVSKSITKTAAGRETRYELRETCLHVELRPGVGVAVSWASVGPYDPEFPLAGQVPVADARAEVLAILRHLRRTVPRALPHVVIILFGSVARGESTWKSDIDLLLVAEPSWLLSKAGRSVDDALADVQDTLTHPVRPHHASIDDLVGEASPLMVSVRHEGLILHAPSKEVRPWKALKRYSDIAI